MDIESMSADQLIELARSKRSTRHVEVGGVGFDVDEAAARSWDVFELLLGAENAGPREQISMSFALVEKACGITKEQFVALVGQDDYLHVLDVLSKLVSEIVPKK